MKKGFYVGSSARALGVVLALGAAADARAQAVAPEATAKEDKSAIGEIVVSAQRRAENLERVPISVTALSAEALQSNDVRDIARVEQVTPGFTFGQSGGDARPAIRGVRTENVAVSGDPTIGYYVDGIYQTRAAQALQPFVDVARVEIERGPQGTLFGRNTFGGAISVVTQPPSKEFEGGINLLGGDYNRRDADGYINVPVTDWLQFRVAAKREVEDGYVKGIDSAHDIYGHNTAYIRGEVKAEPTDALDVTLRYSLWQEKGPGAGAFGYRAGGLYVNPTSGAFDLLQGVPVLADRKVVTGMPSDIYVAGRDIGIPIAGGKLNYDGDVLLTQNERQEAFSGQINYDFGPVQFHSITGYERFRNLRSTDDDFSPLVTSVDFQDDALHSITEELQLGSPTGERLEWIIGYYFLDEKIDRSIFVSLPEKTLSNPGVSNAWPETRSNAGYGQASYFILPDELRLTGGVRYTDDQRFVRRYISTYVNGVGSTVFNGQQFDLHFVHTTWRVGLDYFVRPENLVYFSASTGFRSGGFNSGHFTNPNIPGNFNPESVMAYEVGTKNRFLNDHLKVDIALYREEFSNLQVQNQFLIPNGLGGFVTSSAILNAASAHSQGLEAEVTARPTPELTLIASATLQDAVYDSYASVPAPALYSGTYDLSGHRIPYAPRYKFTGTAYYDYDLGEAGLVRPQATILWSGDYYNTDFNTGLDRQGEYAKLDLRLGWTSASGAYDAELFCDNVTNVVTLNRATFGSAGLNISYDAPRMFGARIGAKF